MEILKKLGCAALLLLFVFIGFAQQAPAHVNWKLSPVTQQGNMLHVRATGIVDKGWHVYAANKELDLPGVTVSVKDSAATISSTKIPSKITAYADVIFENAKLQVYTDSLSIDIYFEKNAALPPAVKLHVGYDVANKEEFLPAQFEQTISFSGEPLPAISRRIKISTIDIKNPVAQCGDSNTLNAPETADKGLMSIFFLGFLGGLIALLTPCVFPMIPLTVAFFLKRSKTKREGITNAFTYGFFIFLIYVLLSTPFHFIDKMNPEILNNISTNVYLNIGFFVIFIVFALSFFGVFEITLPSSLSNRVDSKASTGNIAGIFFMALTLALVSFSCTGPILGSLLAGSLSGNGGAMQLTAGMGGFGLALALPFALFALFPNWLNSMPKSGGWLTSVKIVLGFAELALAFKFFSNADLVMHWNILKREIFLAIWIIIGAALSLYLWNIVKFKHDSPVKKFSFVRVGFAILATAFTLYLIPGVTNTKYANLKLISGFPPPLYYSIYTQQNEMVLGLTGTHDYETGLAMAKKQGKPILLDFTGYACVNCRRMEENVWSQKDVFALMKNNFIVISLYVDDKKKLPVTEQQDYVTKDGATKTIETVGDKWATFETENFEKNSQPWYAIISPDEILLTKPVGYMGSAQQYKEWLQCGLDAMKK